jgi:proteasome lid subunit RPN8/RPN11
MAVAHADTEYGSWMIQGHPVRIEYSLAVMAEICAACVEGLSRMRRGGVEVGGVLFGIRRGSQIHILAWRPASCEHAHGPSFTLSEKDRRALGDLLEAAGQDRALRGLEPVGWYHSHTRSEIQLSEEDLEAYDRFFPEPWQVALVVRPAQFGPSRLGFFFREVDGTVQSDASYLEFSVKPRRAALPPAPEPAGGAVAPRLAANGQLAEAAAEDRDNPPAPLTPPPSFALMEPRASRKWVWLLLVLCLAMAAAGYTARAFWWRSSEPTLSLRVMDLDGQLLVGWDRASAPVQQATRGTFEIHDGSEKQTVEMDGDRLREGSLTYARRSERVDVRFRVERPGSRPAEEFIRFLGQPPPAKPAVEHAETIRQRDELQAQVEKMRADLARRNAQIRRLQQRLNQPAKP